MKILVIILSISFYMIPFLIYIAGTERAIIKEHKNA